MVLNHNFKYDFRGKIHGWTLRTMCRDLKEYLLSLSFDESYNNILCHVSGVDGETSEIFAQEFPFLNIYSIDEDWGKNKQIERNFEERTKFYPNIFKLDGSLQENSGETFSPSITFLDSCKDEKCLIEELNYWLPRMRKGSIISGNHLYFKHYDNHKKLFKMKSTIFDAIGDNPHKIYPDGSWYRIL
jgi:hypothetical protein